MVKKVIINAKQVYLCEVCGLGYVDEESAKACQDYCARHGACSIEITRKAIYYPKRGIKF